MIRLVVPDKRRKEGSKDCCCICGQKVPAFNNPEPLYGPELNCCDECNRLVIQARIRMWAMPEQKKKDYLRKLGKMSFDQLKVELSSDRDGNDF